MTTSICCRLILINEKESLLKELKSLRLKEKSAEERSEVKQQIAKLESEIRGIIAMSSQEMS